MGQSLPNGPIPLPPPEGLDEAQFRVHLNFPHHYSCGIVDDSTSHSPQFGSAVFIQLGCRLFAATAKHCVSRNSLLFSHDEIRLPCRPTDALRRLVHPQHDVGLLEIPNRPGIARCSIHNLCTDFPPIPKDPNDARNHFLFVVGDPCFEHKQLGRTLRAITRTNFRTHPIRVSEDEYDVHFPAAVYRLTESPRSYELIQMPEKPEGFSGGGLWELVGFGSRELFVPEQSLRLYALISRSSDDTRRKVQCVPIRWWLELVRDCYADLRPLIEDRFPILRQPADSMSDI
jgi:hypothetical protein